MIVSARGKIVGGSIPESGIELHIRGLGTILFADIVLIDGINEARSDDIDGALQPETDTGTSRRNCVIRSRNRIEGILGNVERRILEVILLPILKLKRKSALHRADLAPGQLDFGLVDRREERGLGHCLRHTGHMAYIRAVVVIVRFGIIHHQQISVTAGLRTVGNITLLPLAMAISGMAVEAGFSYGSGTKAVERFLILAVIALEEVFAHVEFNRQPLLIDGRSRIFIAALRHIQRRAELSARIPFFRREVAHGLTDVFRIRFNGPGLIFAVPVTGQHKGKGHE